MRAAVVSLALVAGAAARNFTVDDTDPSWLYKPATGVWGLISKDLPCPSCQSQPEPDKVHGSTWHDSTSDEFRGAGSAVLTFEGVAATIYVVCPGPHKGGQYSLSLSFTLDGQANGTFVHSPCSDYSYNYPVHTVSGLERGVHSIELFNHFHDDPLNTSNVLLDYAMIDDGADTPATKKTGPIVNPAVIVLPVLLAASIAVFGLWLYMRKRALRGQPKGAFNQMADYETTPVSYYPPSSYPPTSYRTESSVSTEPSVLSPPATARLHSANPASHDAIDPELEAAFSVIVSRTRAAQQVPPGLSRSDSTASSRAPTQPVDRKHRYVPPPRSTTTISEEDEPREPPSYADTVSRGH
ncbi:hypothetical protein AURDEDRAFT_127321 [Auricularia subglabra TFB-10046 SS5]|nr:hypothetical protein AURDEDRAFT_127321 [Auricularia subglabra TFB-10046 SS5]